MILTREMEAGEEEGVLETDLEDCGVKLLLGKRGMEMPRRVWNSGACAIAPMMLRERERKRRETSGDMVKLRLRALT